MTSLYDRLPRSVLSLGPFVILAGMITVLATTSPLGDVEAIQTATTTEILWTLLVIGLLVGIVPVAIGMLWFPFIQTLEATKLHVVLALSAGVLAFVAVEMTEEAIDYTLAAPSTEFAAGLAIVAFVLTFVVMLGISRWTHRRIRGHENRGLGVAYLVAIGLGLHSLGEGIAIGGALLLGEASLAMLLIVGFILHNVTEGPTVVAAVARDAESPPLYHFVLLGTIAGGPVVLGGWLAIVAFSEVLAAALLAIGTGAIVQVVWEVVELIRFDASTLLARRTVGGFVGGFAFMFLVEVLLL